MTYTEWWYNHYFSQTSMARYFDLELESWWLTNQSWPPDVIELHVYSCTVCQCTTVSLLELTWDWWPQRGAVRPAQLGSTQKPHPKFWISCWCLKMDRFHIKAQLSTFLDKSKDSMTLEFHSCRARRELGLSYGCPHRLWGCALSRAPQPQCSG